MKKIIGIAFAITLMMLPLSASAYASRLYDIGVSKFCDMINSSKVDVKILDIEHPKANKWEGMICTGDGKPSGVVYWYITPDGYIDDMFVSCRPGFTSYSDENIAKMLYISCRLAGLSPEGAKKILLNAKVEGRKSVVTKSGTHKVTLDVSVPEKGKLLYYIIKSKL